MWNLSPNTNKTNKWFQKDLEKKSLFPFTDVFQLLLKHSAPKHCRRTGLTTHELRFICSTDPAAQFIFEPICSFFVHHVCLVGGTLIYWVTKKHGWTPKLLPLTRLRALATNKGYPKQGSYPTRRKDFVVRGWLASPFLVANNRSPQKSFAQTVLQIWKWFEFTQLNPTTPRQGPGLALPPQNQGPFTAGSSR